MFENITNIVLAAATTPSTPDPTKQYPVQCDLYNAFQPIFGKFVGEIEGLKGFAVGIVLLLFGILIITSWHRIRGSIAKALTIVALLAIFSSAIVAFIAVFIPSTCGS